MFSAFAADANFIDASDENSSLAQPFSSSMYNLNLNTSDPDSPGRGGYSSSFHQAGRSTSGWNDLASFGSTKPDPSSPMMTAETFAASTGRELQGVATIANLDLSGSLSDFEDEILYGENEEAETFDVGLGRKGHSPDPSGGFVGEEETTDDEDAIAARKRQAKILESRNTMIKYQKSNRLKRIGSSREEFEMALDRTPSYLRTNLDPKSKKQTHISLPASHSLVGLPQSTKDEIKAKAAYRLNILMCPILRLKRRQIGRIRLSSQRFSRETPSALLTVKMKEHPLFDEWSPEAFQRLHQVATRHSYEQFAVVSYKGTPKKANSIFVLITGTAQVQFNLGGGTGLPRTGTASQLGMSQTSNKLSMTNRSEAQDNNSSVGDRGTLTVSAPYVFNGWTVVDQTCSNYTVVTTSVCDILRIEGPDFRNLLEDPKVIPRSLSSNLKQQALQDRLGDFEKTSSKIDDKLLRESLLFSLGHRAELLSVAKRFSPFCPMDGTVVFKKGSMLHHIYFLEQGTFIPHTDSRASFLRRRSSLNLVDGPKPPKVEATPINPFAERAARKREQDARDDDVTGTVRIIDVESEEGSDKDPHGEIDPSNARQKLEVPSDHQDREDALCQNFCNMLYIGGFFAEFHCYFGIRWTGPDYVAKGSVRAWVIPRREILKLCTDAAMEKLMTSSLRERVAMNLGQDEKMRNAYLAVLRRAPILSQTLRQDAMPSIAFEVAFPRLYFPQEVICSRSQPCDFFFVVLAGKIRVLLEHSTIEMGAGDLGGFPLLVSHNWAHSIIALSPVQMMLLTKPQLTNYLRRKDPGGLAKASHWSSVMLRPSRHSGQDALKLTTLLAGTEPTTPLYSLDVPVATEPRDDKLFLRQMTVRSQASKMINELFDSNKPLSAEVKAGETTVFYKSPRRSGIRAHTNVFVKALQSDAQRRSLKQPTPPSASSTAKSESGRSAILRNRGSKSARDSSSKTMLIFAEQAQDSYTLNRQVDSTMSKHRQKVDRLWTHSSRQVKNSISRMYPPIKRHGSMSRLSSQGRTSMASISSRPAGPLTPGRDDRGPSTSGTTASSRSSSPTLGSEPIGPMTATGSSQTSSAKSPAVSPRSNRQAPQLRLPTSDALRGETMTPKNPISHKR